DTEMKNQLPPDLPTRVNLDKIEELFGGTDMAMIVLSGENILEKESLERLKELSRKMQRLDEIQRVIGLFTAKDLRGEEGSVIVEPAVKRMPKTPEQMEKLKERLSKNPLVYGNLVSKDFKHAVLIGFVNPEAKDEV